MKTAIQRILGIQSPVLQSERMVSSIGGLVAIICVYYLSMWLLSARDTLVVLPSVAASTVLLFAVPHGQLSTPWALFGGHLLSAASGVATFQWLGGGFIPAAVALSCAIFLMLAARCLHPPGGATALAFVAGSPDLQNLGWSFLITPTLLNCGLLFSIAVLFNLPFSWRRYPQSLMRYEALPSAGDTASIIQARHIQEAIARTEVVVDISEDNIKRIIDLAQEILQEEQANEFDLRIGGYYSNGLSGQQWSVRQVVDQRAHEQSRQHLVVYRVVEGVGKGRTDSCNLIEFAQWAKERIIPNRIAPLGAIYKEPSSKNSPDKNSSP
jgi:CBS-domain-containing membrane protein